MLVPTFPVKNGETTAQVPKNIKAAFMSLLLYIPFFGDTKIPRFRGIFWMRRLASSAERIPSFAMAIAAKKRTQPRRIRLEGKFGDRSAALGALPISFEHLPRSVIVISHYWFKLVTFALVETQWLNVWENCLICLKTNWL